MNKLFEIDILILRLIHNHRIELFDAGLLFFSKSAYLIAAGIILYLGFLVFWYKKESIKNIFLRLICMLFTVTLIAILLKYTVLRTRPFDIYPDIINLSGANSPSFPSGHTIIAFTLAFGLLFSYLKWYYCLSIVVWAVIVAYSRLALGAHYPSDVMISIIIAFTTVLLLKKISLDKWIINSILKR